MHTRGKDGVRHPVDRLNLHATPISPKPTSVSSALSDPAWRLAMQEEFDALQANDTWTLVPRPPSVNLVTGKWVFRHKFRSDGSLDRYKARWVVCGFTTVVKPSVLWSNQQLFGQFLLWHFLVHGQFISLM
jgi:histone deacetylase 1/2